ncbi:hypothetical protein ACX27_04265 [Nostoc piscinale CENA21]|uniref:Uncharacterized protein n=1 Tax=Nostoc piscinale CENA21 TaxID=224013 RepID=A0A0M4TT10_9NOSO|nr:hypothetical protein [Nostoc piscinale]ALF52244.1 hypothetical protein ACX27_04265 [Nostoc piscinale CENA21]
MQGSRRIPGGIATLINASNQVRQVNTVTVGTAANSTAYGLIIDGILIDYTSDATATATEIRDGLIAAVNLTGVGVAAIATGAGTFTLTGYPGASFDATILGGGSGYAIASTTAAANSSAIGFGLAVARATSDPENVGRLPTSDLQRFLGVTLHNHKQQLYNPSEGQYKAEYRHTEPMAVVQLGSVWVAVESAVTLDSSVYVRVSADGSLDKIGGFTGTSGSGVILLQGAKWITGGTEIAELLLNGTEIFVD